MEHGAGKPSYPTRVMLRADARPRHNTARCSASHSAVRSNQQPDPHQHSSGLRHPGHPPPPPGVRWEDGGWRGQGTVFPVSAGPSLSCDVLGRGRGRAAGGWWGISCTGHTQSLPAAGRRGSASEGTRGHQGAAEGLGGLLTLS